MVFSSVTFLFYFLPLFLLLYFLTPFKNTVLLLASLLFYAWGEAGYVLLLVVSIFLNYLFGLLIDKHQHNSKFKKSILSIGIGINLLLIGYFKYFNFIIQSVLNKELIEPVHLPLGISFFTFQAISYLVDVYRKEAKVEKHLINLALYISMFPQLIAGPIVRFKTVAQQIVERKHTMNNIALGIKIFIIGLSQKALIANTVAITADKAFAQSESTLTMATAWLGMVCYTLQIYFDFAGYSNMAIGLGLVMGFTFPQNFNYPYISQSITEFWRRWHMSLSSWFRDYLYIPLGGNRVSPIKTYANLMIVFLLCGLWHGAAWTFILWGVYHGAFLMIERYKFTDVLNNLFRPIRHFYTLMVVMIGWVIFRVEDLIHFKYFLLALFGFGTTELPNDFMPVQMTNSLLSALIIGLLFSMPIMVKYKKMLQGFKSHSHIMYYVPAQLVLDGFIFIVFILSLLTIASGSYNPFIYFRF